MADPEQQAILDRLFLKARTRNHWRRETLPKDVYRDIYALVRMGPTANNTTPARFVFVHTNEAKERLAACASGRNGPKILAAPVTVIIGYDLGFPDTLPTLFPHKPELKNSFRDPEATERIAFRNSSLQGGYLILAARALGYDCGPMSGFNNQRVDAEFFASTQIKSNFLCSIGHGNEVDLSDRLPRLSFEEACQIA